MQRRNAAIQPAYRDSLIIDPGPMSIEGTGLSDSSFEMVGKFKSVPVTLGELKTDKVGRLLVLPGFGKAASPSDTPPFNRVNPLAFNNAIDLCLIHI